MNQYGNSIKPGQNDRMEHPDVSALSGDRSLSRRNFVEIAASAMGGLPVMGVSSDIFAEQKASAGMADGKMSEAEISVIGPYGRWAASLTEDELRMRVQEPYQNSCQSSA